MANEVYTEENRQLSKQIASQGIMLQISALISAGALAGAAMNFAREYERGGNQVLSIALGALGLAGTLYTYYKGVEYQVGRTEVEARIKTNQLKELFDKGASKEDIIRASSAMDTPKSWKERASRNASEETSASL